MTEASQLFLFDKLGKCDLVKLSNIYPTSPQTFRGIVEYIYTAKNGVDPKMLGKEIEFIGSPNCWGNMILKQGETAYVFVSKIGKKLYQDSWRGHLVIEEIDGQQFAIFQAKEMWLSEDYPQLIKENSRQDPKRPFASAIRLQAFEEYIAILINAVRPS